MFIETTADSIDPPPIFLTLQVSRHVITTHIHVCRVVLCNSSKNGIAHRIIGLFTGLMGFVADQRNDHAVQVEEEHQEVETQLDERFLYSKEYISQCAAPGGSV